MDKTILYTSQSPAESRTTTPMGPNTDVRQGTPDPHIVDSWAADSHGVAEAAEAVRSHYIDKGYRLATEDAIAGRLQHQGIYNQEQVEAYVKAARGAAMEELQKVLSGYKATVRFPEETAKFFTQLEQDHANLF